MGAVSTMKLVIKTASGSYNLDVNDSDTVGQLLKKAMEKHQAPVWADGVQLKADGNDEDYAERTDARISGLGFSNGSVLKMAYYQDVNPKEAKALKAQGVYPGSSVPFLARKA